MAKNIADTGDVHVQTHIEEGGGAVQVSERGDVTKDDEDSGDAEEAQQVELPPEGNDEPVEEMHEGLNKFPPDNFANEPTAV